MPSARSYRYVILFSGYLLIWGTYFGFKVSQFIPRETSNGEIIRLRSASFIVDVPAGRGSSGGAFHGNYPCPEIRFTYKSDIDPGKVYTVAPQAFSFRQYKVGDKVSVIFPKGQPTQAVLYSISEFWLPPPYLIILIVLTLFWTIIFLVIVFKPWRSM